ncbi:MAG: TolB family protein [Dehalococcoidia bacterium]
MRNLVVLIVLCSLFAIACDRISTRKVDPTATAPESAPATSDAASAGAPTAPLSPSATPTQTQSPPPWPTPGPRREPTMPEYVPTPTTVTPLTLRPLGGTPGSSLVWDRGRRPRLAIFQRTPSRFVRFASGSSPLVWEWISDKLVLADASDRIVVHEPTSKDEETIAAGDNSTRLVNHYRYGNAARPPSGRLEVVRGETRSVVWSGEAGVNAELSPDGSRVAYFQPGTVDGRQLVLLDVRSGDTRRIDLGKSRGGGGDSFQIWYDYAPIWSPSGRFVRFAFAALDGRDVVIVDAESGSVRRFRACDGAIHVPQWAPDRDHIVIERCVDRVASYAVLDASTGELIPVPSGASQFAGRAGLLIGRTGGVELVDEAGRSVQKWNAGSIEDWGVPSGLRAVRRDDGPVFASTSRGDDCPGTVVSLPKDGSATRCVVPREGGQSVAVGWSPDGRLLTIVEELRSDSDRSPIRSSVTVRVIDTLTTTETIVIHFQAETHWSLYYVPIWAADGSRLVVYSFETVI